MRVTEASQTIPFYLQGLDPSVHHLSKAELKALSKVNHVQVQLLSELLSDMRADHQAGTLDWREVGDKSKGVIELIRLLNPALLKVIEAAAIRYGEHSQASKEWQQEWDKSKEEVVADLNEMLFLPAGFHLEVDHIIWQPPMLVLSLPRAFFNQVRSNLMLTSGIISETPNSVTGFFDSRLFLISAHGDRCPIIVVDEAEKNDTNLIEHEKEHALQTYALNWSLQLPEPPTESHTLLQTNLISLREKLIQCHTFRDLGSFLESSFYDLSLGCLHYLLIELDALMAEPDVTVDDLLAKANRFQPLAGESSYNHLLITWLKASYEVIDESYFSEQEKNQLRWSLQQMVEKYKRKITLTSGWIIKAFLNAGSTDLPDFELLASPLSRPWLIGSTTEYETRSRKSEWRAPLRLTNSLKEKMLGEIVYRQLEDELDTEIARAFEQLVETSVVWLKSQLPLDFHKKRQKRPGRKIKDVLDILLYGHYRRMFEEYAQLCKKLFSVLYTSLTSYTEITGPLENEEIARDIVEVISGAFLREVCIETVSQTLINEKTKNTFDKRMIRDLVTKNLEIGYGDSDYTFLQINEMRKKALRKELKA